MANTLSLILNNSYLAGKVSCFRTKLTFKPKAQSAAKVASAPNTEQVVDSVKNAASGAAEKAQEMVRSRAIHQGSGSDRGAL